MFSTPERVKTEGEKTQNLPEIEPDNQRSTLNVTFMGQSLNPKKVKPQPKVDSLASPIEDENIAPDSVKKEPEDLMLLLLEDSLATLNKKLVSFRQPTRMHSPNALYRDIPSILPIRIRSWAEYRVSSGFGMRIHPIKGTYQNHSGLDFPQPKFSPVFATADGVVDRVIWQPDGMGLAIYITHSSGYQTGYGHLEDHSVLVGETVKRGQQIGRVGSTGLSTGPHLHYTVLAGNQPVDPTEFCFLMLNALNAQASASTKAK